MEDVRDILMRRAESIGVGTGDTMQLIKDAIITRLHVEVRVAKLQHQIATISTEDASAASEIRLHKTELLKTINQSIAETDNQLKNIVIIIR